MRYLKSLLVASVLATSTFAQTIARIAFTSVPGVAVAGATYNVTWAGGNGSPVTLTLRQGDPKDLATIAIVASRVSGYSYQWTVSTSVASGTDYALQITQGQSDINYSGLFSIIGGTGTLSISAPGITLPPQANASAALSSASSAASANLTSNAAANPLNVTSTASNGTTAAAAAATNSTTMMTSTSTSAAAAGSSSSSRPSSVSASATTSRASTTAAGGAANSGQTNFPTSTSGPGAPNAPPQWASFAALVVGVVAAVIGLN